MDDQIRLAVCLLVATAAGALVGFERESNGQLAGVRTHALVSIGACLFSVVGAYGFADVASGTGSDPTRLAAQVVSGIGFIGAGAIIRDRGEIRGVTTAASLWASAALGVASGSGLFSATAMGLLAVLFALVGLRVLRDKFAVRLRTQRHAVDVSYHRGHGTLGPIVAALEEMGGNLERVRIDDEPDLRHVQLVVRARSSETLRSAFAPIAGRAEVIAITFR